MKCFMDNEPLESQVDRLAKFILREYPEWIGNAGDSEGAIDCAIRILKAQNSTKGRNKEA